MADNNMSASDIKNILINTFKKSAEKSIQDADYDKTILATIQYCSDATIGQYKIKYHDGYYTAYSRDLDTIYLNDSKVYVLVPGNDMNNRMFITGLASNDNKQKVYVSSLEGDQQYYKEGSNYIIGLNGDSNIHMSSYWGQNKLYRKTLWSADETIQRYITINSNVDEYFKDATSIRLGASFKTDLIDSRKNGDYGLIVTLKYKNSTQGEYYKQFIVDTFSMTGSPFNFNTYVPQYLYWDLSPEHKTDFVRLERVEEFVGYFPSGEEPSPEYRDIFVKDISLHKAKKLYDTNNDKYKVAIYSEDDFAFLEKNEILCTAELRVDGNPVSELAGQNVEYYWAKEDGSVNSVNHPKYNKYTGKGWYCLNTGSKQKYDGEQISELANYTILQTDTTVSNEYIIWDSNLKNILLDKDICKGKITRIKCVVFYENTIISSEIKEVYNQNGYYIILNSEDGKVQSLNSIGNFTLNAGVFKDEGGDAPVSYTLDSKISYTWSETDETGLERTLPPTAIEEVLLSNEDWNETFDNETLTDEEVATYLSQDVTLAVCKERYEYYDNKYNLLYESEDPDATQLSRCQQRRNYAYNTKQSQIQQMYQSEVENSTYYILGPSDVTGQYTNEELKDYRSVALDTVVHNYYGGGSYSDKTNTLFRLPATKIGNKASYTVTALLTENGLTQAIGTQTLTLLNEAGASLDYSLEIVNGIQAFVYNEGGIAPTYLIRPLYFKIYNKDGDRIYDSQHPEATTDESINIDSLQPIWRFYDAPYSLIQTGYKGSSNCTVVGDTLELRYAGQFNYSLATEYDVNKKEQSNISLQVTINGSIVTGSTEFIFIKEGELGTNGTNMALDIDDNTYNVYKNNILSEEKWSTFNTIEGGLEVEKYYQPQQRHLNNTYLYATMCYDGSGNPLSTVAGANYVNLKFAQYATPSGDEDIEGGVSLVGSDIINLAGYWYQNGNRFVIDASSEWSEEVGKGIYNNKSYYMRPSFIVGSQGSIASLQINKVSEDPYYAYKPTKIEDVIIDGTTYDYKIANNTVRVESSRVVDEITGIKRTNYGYFQIPYFYFNYTGTESMPSGIDPARHIVITGGFDEVVYDNAGLNPVYNKQEPFSFYLFDENGNDITTEALNGISTSKTYIEWTCSNAFINSNNLTPTAASNIQNYADIPATRQLYKQYCRYNGNYYQCIKNYTKSDTVVIKGDKDEVINTYQPGQFVDPYWIKIDLNREVYQKYSVTPINKYEMLAQKDLFNSWVRFYIRYMKNSNRTYEAEVLIPINVICNKYGSDEINNWDGKKSVVDDSYIISSKIAAGVKNTDNTFTGITLGTNFYPDNENRKPEVGLFGYGKSDPSNTNTWARTLYIDSNTGRAIFGPSGGTQIVLDPTIPTSSNTEVWSRLAGWYFSPNYFYKPIGENTILPSEYGNNFTNLAQGERIEPPASPQGSVGMYCPWNQTVTDDTVWLWADNQGQTYTGAHKQSKFYLTYGGKLYCQEADIQGKITALTGQFGTGVNKIDIAKVKDGQNYILYNRNFWVRDSSGTEADDSAVYIKGKIMAKSGQFGQVGDDKDGNSSGTVFIEYNWYPWHLPAENEEWNNQTMYLDTTEGMSQTYALYHKNFYVTNTGNAVFNGKLFTESGRVGNWVINKNYLKSVNGNIRLASDRLTIGEFSADQYGNLRGPMWYILADGRASFTNTGNEFVGKTFRTANGSSMGEGGLRLGPGDKFFIGEGDGTYMYALNNGFSFNGLVDFADTVTLRSALEFVSGGSSAVTINSSGIRFGNTGKSITSGGNATLGSVAVDSLTIGGTSLADYIRSVVSNMGYLTSSSLTSARLSDLSSNSYVVTGVRS